MKKFIFFARVYTLWILAFPLCISAQDTATIYPNYVVIGAFEFHQNAVQFTDEANKNSYPAKFEMNPNRNLYYVYVLTTHDRPLAFAEARKLRTDTKYFDTWVYSGPFGEEGLAQNGTGQHQDFNPETGGQLSAVTGGHDRVQQTGDATNPRPPTGDGARAVNSTDIDPLSNTSLNGAEPETPDEKSGAKTSRRKNGKAATQAQAEPTGATAGKQMTLDESVTSGSTTDPLTATRQNEIQTPGNGRSNAEATGQQQGVQAGQVAGQTSKQGVNTGQTVASGKNVNQATGTAAQRNSQATGQSLQDAGQTSVLGPAKPETLTSSQDPGKTGAIGLNGAVQGDQRAATNAQNNESITSIPAERETDKALTESGRKALAENRARQAALGPPPQRATTAPLTKEEIAGKDFYFHLFRADNLDMVDGEVDAVDVEKSRRMATYQGNTTVKVMMPSGKTKNMSFVCQVFGYRKQQREFDPSSPPEDLYLDDKGNLVVPFELIRMQRGDIAIMYNVFFFKDAAVMRPESRYEVNNLLDLLAENPTYKIRIHGHTNGNATGKIIRMDTPGNFYSLSGTKQGFGSAKELSEDRALVIREFLINSGISSERMEVRAWGGKKPIHDKHSARANENVRVEIEILPE